MALREHHRPLLAWPRASLRTYLVAMILAATVPLAALMSYQIVDDVRQQSELLSNSLQAVAKAVANSVDQELASSIDALTVLTRADALRRNDLAAFSRLLGSAKLLRPSWSGTFLLRSDGSVLLDTRGVRHDPASPALLEGEEWPTTAGRPIPGRAWLSNLVDASNPARRVTAIAVPVVMQDGLPYSLGAFVNLDVWQKLVEGNGPRGGGFAALFDSRHRLIARNLEPERFVGASLPASAVTSMGGRESGVQRAVLLDGRDAYAAWQIVDHGGWGVSVGVPAESIDAAHDRAALVALGTAIGCLLLGVAAAMLVARRMTVPLGQLATRGASSAAPIAVLEIARLRDALTESAAQSQVAADRLAKKAEEFETLFHSSPLGLAFAQDARCSVVLRNAAMDRMVPASIAWGAWRSPEGPPPDVLHDGLPLTVERQPLCRAAMQGETVSALELEVRQPGRPPQFVLASAVPLCDSQGRPRGAIGAMVDITERKQAEAMLRASEQELRQSQNLVNLAQEVGNVGFFHYDWQTGQLSLSPGQSRLLAGGARHEAQGIEVWKKCVDAAERRRVAKEIQELVAARAASGRIEFPVDLGGDTARWLESRLVIEYRADGRPLQIIGLTIDISETKSVERERESMMRSEQAARLEAEAANRAKDEFLSMLGHELRNPLNAIATSVEVLHRAEAAAPEAVSARAIITRQSRKLARMMDDLLDVGRVIANKVKLLRQPFDLGALLQRRMAAAQAGAAIKGQTLDAEPAEVWIQADAQRLTQVLDALLDNAVKYSAAGARIDVRLCKSDGDAVLRVHDSGDAIAPELLGRIFEPFVQGERRLDRQDGGLGIGLTLVRSLVEMHGGSVRAHSDSTGNVFELRLPSTEPPNGERPEGERPEVATAPRQSRIVVVDDNPDALSGLRSVLELGGHAVETSIDGAAGLAMLLDHAPDLAIVDIGLPVLDGYEVARRSRAAGYRGRLIALSGYGQENDRLRSRAAGFEAHLVKPVDVEQLLRLLASG